jgi:D-alanine-D-alanine ligase
MMSSQTVTGTGDILEEASEPPDPPGPGQILVIYSVVDTLERGEPSDLLADMETAEIAHSISEALQASGHVVIEAPIRSEADLRTALHAIDPATTLVFNLCEALGGAIDGETRVARVLEAAGVRYSGGTPDNLDCCRDKAFTKARLLEHGVSTAPYQVFNTAAQAVTVPLPAIVKPVAEDSSAGITPHAVVHDERALRERVAYVLQTYRQAALVEMFLDGREFNVSIWGSGAEAHVLGIGESIYPGAAPDESIMDFDSKWVPESPEYTDFKVLYPAPVDAVLEGVITRLALDAYRVMGCRDYARVDMREKDGQLYVLEVNPNPCLASDGGFANAARAAGLTYAQMAHQIARLAWQRYTKSDIFL